MQSGPLPWPSGNKVTLPPLPTVGFRWGEVRKHLYLFQPISSSQGGFSGGSVGSQNSYPPPQREWEASTLGVKEG